MVIQKAQPWNSILQIEFHKQDRQAPPNLVQYPGYGPNSSVNLTYHEPMKLQSYVVTKHEDVSKGV